MKAILTSENCLKAIDERPENIEDEKWEKINSAAMLNIYLSVTDDIVVFWILGVFESSGY